jgi:mannose-6-phosphate isomerase-like protein (cupin superfamily)
MDERDQGNGIAQACSAEPYLRRGHATLFRSYFTDRRTAIEEIADDGWWPVAWMDPANSSYPAHHHKNAESLYLLDGEMELTDIAADVTFTLKPFDKLILPARLVHRVASTPGTTYLIGLSVLEPFDDHFIVDDVASDNN